MNLPPKKTESIGATDVPSQPQDGQKLTTTDVLAVITAYLMAAATFVAIVGAIVYLPGYIAAWLGWS